MKRHQSSCNFSTSTGETVFVKPLGEKDVYDYAPKVLALLAIAYRTFEDGDEPLLCQGAVLKHFMPHDELSQDQQARRMLAYLRGSGSVYRVAERPADDPAEVFVQGLIKTTPSRSGLQKLLRRSTGQDNPNCYVNDIAARVRGCGIGSMLLLTALQPYDHSNVVVADVIGGTEPFFEQFGMRPTRTLEKPLMIQDGQLPLVRYEGVIGDVVTAATSRISSL
jgi:hypothetical protein